MGGLHLLAAARRDRVHPPQSGIRRDRAGQSSTRVIGHAEQHVRAVHQGAVLAPPPRRVRSCPRIQSMSGGPSSSGRETTSSRGSESAIIRTSSGPPAGWRSRRGGCRSSRRLQFFDRVARSVGRAVQRCPTRSGARRGRGAPVCPAASRGASAPYTRGRGRPVARPRASRLPSSRTSASSGAALTEAVSIAPAEGGARHDHRAVREHLGHRIQPRRPVGVVERDPRRHLAAVRAGCRSSASTNSRPSSRASANPNVDLPEPDTPITTTEQRKTSDKA